jgi:NAD(P)-dependent dehydrogenase (short-subunit alcohol dehydrogenase family)
MSDAFSLEGKSVLVTGSSSGIGLEVAGALAKEGAKVFVTGRNEERLRTAFEGLAGDGHASLVADLTVEDDLKALVEAVPVLDGVVLNAGIIPRLIPYTMVDRKHIDNVMDINFTAPANLVNQLLRKKKMANGSSIVFNTSIGGFIAPAASAIYAASKAALTALSRSIALDVAKRGIRSNCVALGYVKTELTIATVPDYMIDLTPAGVAEPSEVTGPVLFLLSDASRWITRTTVIVDGGLSLKSSLGM